ncbi:Uncharacterised protein [Mycobacteroides abscessus subsp. abscessus]|nr:Uncharacterised protein [Mycobacteroides abscessus subsp. abscessus]
MRHDHRGQGLEEFDDDIALAAFFQSLEALHHKLADLRFYGGNLAWGETA